MKTLFYLSYLLTAFSKNKVKTYIKKEERKKEKARQMLSGEIELLTDAYFNGGQKE